MRGTRAAATACGYCPGWHRPWPPSAPSLRSLGTRGASFSCPSAPPGSPPSPQALSPRLCCSLSGLTGLQCRVEGTGKDQATSMSLLGAGVCLPPIADGLAGGCRGHSGLLLPVQMALPAPAGSHVHASPRPQCKGLLVCWWWEQVCGQEWGRCPDSAPGTGTRSEGSSSTRLLCWVLGAGPRPGLWGLASGSKWLRGCWHVSPWFSRRTAPVPGWALQLLRHPSWFSALLWVGLAGTVQGFLSRTVSFPSPGQHQGRWLQSGSRSCLLSQLQGWVEPSTCLLEGPQAGNRCGTAWRVGPITAHGSRPRKRVGRASWLPVGRGQS